MLTAWKVHPAVARIDYTLGRDSSSLMLHDVALASLSVHTDLLTMPAVETLQVTLNPTGLSIMTQHTRSINFTVCNPDGVRISDLFHDLVIECVRIRNRYTTDGLQESASSRPFKRRQLRSNIPTFIPVPTANVVRNKRIHQRQALRRTCRK